MRGLPSNIAQLPSADRREQLRILEALLFAASEPLAEAYLASHLKSNDDVPALLEELQGFYASRGINLMRVAGKWAFRTAEDLAYLLERHATEQRKLSKAAMETLAIIAYHQPVTRAEIEEIRGVAVSAGTIDVLMEVDWVRPRGRRRAPGRPITYGTTDQFLEHFGFDGIKDLPGLTELKGSGLLRQQSAARLHGARAQRRHGPDARRAAARRGRGRNRRAAPRRRRRRPRPEGRCSKLPRRHPGLDDLRAQRPIIESRDPPAVRRTTGPAPVRRVVEPEPQQRCHIGAIVPSGPTGHDAPGSG